MKQRWFRAIAICLTLLVGISTTTVAADISSDIGTDPLNMQNGRARNGWYWSEDDLEDGMLCVHISENMEVSQQMAIYEAIQLWCGEALTYQGYSAEIGVITNLDDSGNGPQWDDYVDDDEDIDIYIRFGETYDNTGISNPVGRDVGSANPSVPIAKTVMFDINGLSNMNDTTPCIVGEISKCEIRITESDVTISETNLNGKFHLKSVVAHEFGHALGIAHCHETGENCRVNCNNDNVMSVGLSAGEIRFTLKPYDLSSFIVIYSDSFIF